MSARPQLFTLRLKRLRALVAFTAIAGNALAVGLTASPTITRPEDLAAVYAREVDRRLELSEAEQSFYASLLLRELQGAGVRIESDQFVVLVDRSEHAQAAMLWWVAANGRTLLIGASPASTGRPAGFEHFETPTGVFDHSLDNLDFRAEGTLNQFGIRGYGDKGNRVYDFGWVVARRGWAAGEQAMRLQLHATDRERLEPRLGRRESKGCIRIPATLNTLIDQYGVLDAAYDEAIATGREFWVLKRDRTPTAWSGRSLVVVDSQRSERPAWSPLPRGATSRSAHLRAGSRIAGSGVDSPKTAAVC